MGFFGGGGGGGRAASTSSDSILSAVDEQRNPDSITNQMKRMQDELDQQTQKANDLIKKEEKGVAPDTATQRQKKKAQGAYGRSDTILTGPLGLTASGPKSGKTLLGA